MNLRAPICNRNKLPGCSRVGQMHFHQPGLSQHWVSAAGELHGHHDSIVKGLVLALPYLAGLRIVLTFSSWPILTARALSATTETSMPNRGFCFDFHILSRLFSREDPQDSGKNISVTSLSLLQMKQSPPSLVQYLPFTIPTSAFLLAAITRLEATKRSSRSRCTATADCSPCTTQ